MDLDIIWLIKVNRFFSILFNQQVQSIDLYFPSTPLSLTCCYLYHHSSILLYIPNSISRNVIFLYTICVR